jgi:hypothetical protein
VTSDHDHDHDHDRMDAARVRAELSIQDLWLRYLALGGTNDAFDLDGYLQGLVQLDSFQTDVLAQAVNEALQDSYTKYCLPMDTSPAARTADDARLRTLIDELLDEPPSPRPRDPNSSHDSSSY